MPGLICNLLSILKMCPSAFRVSSPPGPGWRGLGQTCTKTFLGQVGMCVQNFIKIGAGVWISISPPHTNTQTNICMPIFIYIEDRRYIDLYHLTFIYTTILCQNTCIVKRLAENCETLFWSGNATFYGYFSCS